MGYCAVGSRHTVTKATNRGANEFNPGTAWAGWHEILGEIKRRSQRKVKVNGDVAVGHAVFVVVGNQSIGSSWLENLINIGS